MVENYRIRSGRRKLKEDVCETVNKGFSGVVGSLENTP